MKLIQGNKKYKILLNRFNFIFSKKSHGLGYLRIYLEEDFDLEEVIEIKNEIQRCLFSTNDNSSFNFLLTMYNVLDLQNSIVKCKFIKYERIKLKDDFYEKYREFDRVLFDKNPLIYKASGIAFEGYHNAIDLIKALADTLGYEIYPYEV